VKETDPTILPGRLTFSPLHLIGPSSFLPAFLISATVTAWCWFVVGAGFGLFLGALLLTACYTPGLVLAETKNWPWLAALGAACGVSITLGIATAFVDVSLLEWLQCSLVLASFIAALAGLTLSLAALRLPASLVATAVVPLALLWLCWPVWMSHWLNQSIVNWLVPAHPWFAINSVIKHLSPGTWDRAQIAYRSLTVLNQDIPYRLPGTIWPAVGVHLVIGAIGVFKLREASSASSPSPGTPGEGRGGGLDDGRNL
jgi:hypothetical protein